MGTWSAVRGLMALHDQFAQAPLLGSLLEVEGGDLLDADWRERQDEALARPPSGSAGQSQNGPKVP